jgi:hypothetical protein
MEIKYEIPELEITNIKDNKITLKLNQSEIDGHSITTRNSQASVTKLRSS